MSRKSRQAVSGFAGRLRRWTGCSPTCWPTSPTCCGPFRRTGSQPLPHAPTTTSRRCGTTCWLPVFAAALADPDGAAPRPDPQTHQAPADPDAAAAEVTDAAQRMTKALDGGVADRPVQLLGAALPGSAVVGMVLGEVIAHGWDLARAADRPWNPAPVAVRSALATMGGMITPEFRGHGKGFGAEVPVPADAAPLDRLLAFTGRDPAWTCDR